MDKFFQLPYSCPFHLDFDEQVVVIDEDLDGAVVPVEGSDAARLLADPAGVS